MVALVTSHSANNKAIYDLTKGNHSDYCQRHGYKYIPLTEEYQRHIDTARLRKVLDEYDHVLLMGCDVWIQRPSVAVESFAEDGLSMCRELRAPCTLNGDLLLFIKSPDTDMILEYLDRHQQEYPHTQAALNGIPGLIHNVPTMQVAFPGMNPSVDYRKIDVTQYFALHFHTMGKAADLGEKFRYLSNYARSQK